MIGADAGGAVAAHPTMADRARRRMMIIARATVRRVASRQAAPSRVMGAMAIHPTITTGSGISRCARLMCAVAIVAAALAAPASAQQRDFDRPRPAGPADRAAPPGVRGAAAARDVSAGATPPRTQMRHNPGDTDNRFGSGDAAPAEWRSAEDRVTDTPALRSGPRIRKVRYDADCRRPAGVKDRFRPGSAAYRTRCGVRANP